MKRRRRSFRRFLGYVLVVLVVAALASVTPVDWQPYAGTAAFQKTAADLDAAAAQVTFTDGPLMAGFGKATLTPTLTGTAVDWRTGTFPGLPLAGDSARLFGKATGVHDPLWVKSVALEVGGQRVVLTALDMLLIPPEVTALVTADLPSLGLDRAGLYLGATHTHSGPGGWGGSWVDAIAAGFHRDGMNRWIAQQIEASIRAAIADLKPATLAEGWKDIPDLVWNRTDATAPAHPGFPLLLFAQTGGRKAVFGSYAGHPAILGAENYELSGDYPGAWQRAMEARGYDMAMFMAGPVGGQSMHGTDGTFAAVEEVGATIADRVTPVLAGLPASSTAILARIGIAVTLPEPQVRITDNWRLRPWVAEQVLPFRPQTFLQAVRIGNTILFSTPCDYAGELALPLEKTLAGEGLTAAVTSFNGDYLGYVMPTKYDHTPGYETRELAFFGPGFGDFAAAVLDREAAALKR